MDSGPYFQPPHGHLSEIVPADGWCVTDDDGIHRPLVAWALIQLEGSRSSRLAPFASPFDEPDGTFDRGSVLDTFEPVTSVVMCGAACGHYRERYLDQVKIKPHFGAYPHPGSLAQWNVISAVSASGWCAVYKVDPSEVEIKIAQALDDDPFAPAHSPLAAWALVEERGGKAKNRWRGVVGLDASGSVTGPTVASNFMRYSRCGISFSPEHLDTNLEDGVEDE